MNMLRLNIINIINSLLCILLFGCHTTSRKVADSSEFVTIKMIMRVDGYNKNTRDLKIILVIESVIDSVIIDNIDLLHPSYVERISPDHETNILLQKDEMHKFMSNFKIHRMESFKLKAVVYGSYNYGRSKISYVKYLYFYRNGDVFIITDNVNELIGRKKKSGDRISREDLSIFNRIESVE